MWGVAALSLSDIKGGREKRPAAGAAAPSKRGGLETKPAAVAVADSVEGRTIGGCDTRRERHEETEEERGIETTN